MELAVGRSGGHGVGGRAGYLGALDTGVTGSSAPEYTPEALVTIEINDMFDWVPVCRRVEPPGVWVLE